MPGFDRTGPLGKGSRTGRGLGKCTPAKGEGSDENNETQFGRGLGRGRNARIENREERHADTQGDPARDDGARAERR